MLDLISIVYMVEFKRMNIIVGGQPDPASDHVHRSHPHRRVDADPYRLVSRIWTQPLKKLRK